MGMQGSAAYIKSRSLLQVSSNCLHKRTDVFNPGNAKRGLSENLVTPAIDVGYDFLKSYNVIMDNCHGGK